MMQFLKIIQSRNPMLYWFGFLCFIIAGFLFLISQFPSPIVMGVNAWYKPTKFALSIGIYSWTMGWFTFYLGRFKGAKTFNWSVILLLGFEIVYITLQAGRGQLSHYNVSHPFYAGLYVLMAVAATIVTVWTAYIGVLFFKRDIPALPDYYLWAIRIGIIIFVIFSLQGFVMGSQMTHTIGGPDGDHGIPFLNWSKKFGDPRVAHFIGMHALQVLPLMAKYLLKNVKLTFFVGFLYGILAVFTLIQALEGKPFIKF
jgi:hypothetical protein